MISPRIALVVPKDYPSYTGAPFSRDYWLPGYDAIKSAAAQVKLWIEEETGYTYDYETQLHFSNMTLREIMTAGSTFVEPIPWWDGDNPNEKNPAPGLRASGNQRAPTPEGQGCDENRVWHNIVRGEMGWANSPFPNRRDYRWFVVLVGAGGYAGGRAGKTPTEDYGEALWGDWFLRLIMTGKADPACMAEYHNYLRNPDGTPKVDAEGHWLYEERGFCDPVVGNAFGSLAHEIMHAFDVDSHYPLYLSLGSPWSQEQRDNFIARNQQFITKLPDAPAPPAPTLTAVNVQPGVTIMRPGQHVQLVAKATYSDGSVKAVSPTWRASNSVVTVDALGSVRARRRGSVVVTAAFETITGVASIKVR